MDKDLHPQEGSAASGQTTSDYIEATVGPAAVKAKGSIVNKLVNMLGASFLSLLVADVITDGDVDMLTGDK